MALLAFGALAVIPAVAQAAEPHWLWAKPAEVIPEGTPVPVLTSGGFKFAITGPKKEKIASFECKVADKDMIENPVGGGAGKDEMISFEFTSCGAKGVCSTGAPYTLIPSGLPWSSKLLPGTPVKNALFMEFKLACGGAILSTFSGMEFPTIKGFGGMNFTPATGSLTDGFGKTMTIKGKDLLKGPSPKEKISAV
ncbi:MAG: hypothetical protein ACYDC2_11390 [Solirubrobacteraceae bacterium]